MIFFFSALFLTNLTYSGYNTLTDNGRNDVLDGLVSIMVVSFFCFIGIYSQKLARRCNKIIITNNYSFGLIFCCRLYTHKMICKMMQFKVREKRIKVILSACVHHSRLGSKARLASYWASSCWPASSSSSTCPPSTSCTAPATTLESLAG